jgi:hypothetical protein
MTEQELKAEARLMAIEYMITNVYVLLHRVFRSTPEMIRQSHEGARSMLGQMTIPGLDPAQSDLASAEIQAAVEKLIVAIEEMSGTAGK